MARDLTRTTLKHLCIANSGAANQLVAKTRKLERSAADFIMVSNTTYRVSPQIETAIQR
ncbi:hypothetical protein [Mastigocoleus testarum]|uniref:hypothetical protein n=1 Tax=Mastigocoleus testarum TaxID=996925 RepID=UPI0003F4DFA0|nr:hypothetical protein [Mastigocoleus testarum]